MEEKVRKEGERYEWQQRLCGPRVPFQYYIKMFSCQYRIPCGGDKMFIRLFYFSSRISYRWQVRWHLYIETNLWTQWPNFGSQHFKMHCLNENFISLFKFH